MYKNDDLSPRRPKQPLESPGKKVLNTLCALAPFIISLSFSIEYYKLVYRVNAYDRQHGEGSYDRCNLFVDGVGEEAEI